MVAADQIKQDFPVYKTYPSLVYLDSAATSLKPDIVVSKLVEYYNEYPSNIHRGIYHISERATEEYEETRKVISLFVNASSPDEIIFTKNTTEAINLLSATLSNILHLSPDDHIAVTIFEHHSNFLPWQRLCQETGAKLTVLGVDDDIKVHAITTADICKHVTTDTKILSITAVSNVLGTTHSVQQLIAEAKRINPSIITIVDAAQAAPHVRLDVQALGCDFIAFSGHKMFGPTGVGVLWGRRDVLMSLPPYQVGGGMIRSVQIGQTEYDDLPSRFEAGTPDIASVIALKTAVSYLEYVGLDRIEEHCIQLSSFIKDELQSAFADRLHFPYVASDNKDGSGILSFHLEGIHPHDIAQILDEDQVAVRAGHHCTQPLHSAFGYAATTRISTHIYNGEEDIIRFIKSLKRAEHILKKNSSHNGR